MYYNPSVMYVIRAGHPRILVSLCLRILQIGGQAEGRGRDRQADLISLAHCFRAILLYLDWNFGANTAHVHMHAPRKNTQAGNPTLLTAEFIILISPVLTCSCDYTQFATFPVILKPSTPCSFHPKTREAGVKPVQGVVMVPDEPNPKDMK